LLYRYVLSEQFKWIPTTPKKFVSDAFGIDEKEVNFDAKDAMLNFVETITDKARTARVSDGELKIKGKIGQGTDSEVYESEWFGMKVAVKFFRYNVSDSDLDLDNDKDVIDSFSNEAAIMMGLRHPNIMNLMGFGIKPPQHFIIMKYMPRGSLFHVIGNKEISLDADRKKQMMLGVASAMNYMHTRSPPVLHADMKSLNLLVDEDWSLCISDFGFSKELRKSYDEDRGCGTLQWLAPEGLDEKAKSTKEADVYGFG
jgi:serine/threonine protein kinase